MRVSFPITRLVLEPDWPARKSKTGFGHAAVKRSRSADAKLCSIKELLTRIAAAGFFEYAIWRIDKRLEWCRECKNQNLQLKLRAIWDPRPGELRSASNQPERY